MISLLTAVMYLRNPAQLSFMRGFHGQIVEAFSQPPGLPDEIEIAGKIFPFDKDGWPAYRDTGEEEIKRIWLQEVGSAVFLAKIFLDMRWSIVCSDEPVFITSDNPVTPIHSELRFRGFRNPGTAVMFPLIQVHAPLNNARVRPPFRLSFHKRR
jgi:hypothetical protein